MEVIVTVIVIIIIAIIRTAVIVTFNIMVIVIINSYGRCIAASGDRDSDAGDVGVYAAIVSVVGEGVSTEETGVWNVSEGAIAVER